MRRVSTAACALLVVIVCNAPLPAQDNGENPPSGRPPTRVPVTVVLQDTTNQSAGYRILRRTDARLVRRVRDKLQRWRAPGERGRPLDAGPGDA